MTKPSKSHGAKTAEGRLEQLAAARAALPNSTQILDLLEEQPMSMQEIADAFNVSTVKLRPVLAEGINAGDFELRSHRYLLGPRYDPVQEAACAEAAVEVVRRAMEQGQRYTAIRLCQLTGLARSTIDMILQQMDRNGEVKSMQVLQLRLYERA